MMYSNKIDQKNPQKQTATWTQENLTLLICQCYGVSSYKINVRKLMKLHFVTSLLQGIRRDV